MQIILPSVLLLGQVARSFFLWCTEPILLPKNIIMGHILHIIKSLLRTVPQSKATKDNSNYKSDLRIVSKNIREYIIYTYR